jgi:guanylate kinase
MPELKYQFIIITGPSCVGKSPLRRTFYKYHSELAQDITLLTLYTSRLPRPGEQEGEQYFFRSRTEIEALKGKGYIVEEVRGDIQAVETETIVNMIQEGKKVLYDGNPFIAKNLAAFAQEHQLDQASIFLAPLRLDELESFLESHTQAQLEQTLTEYMQLKLLARASKHKANLGLSDISDIQRRAASTYKELRMAPTFDFVIPNHDGEDSSNWELFGYPIGDAGNTLKTFVQILLEKDSDLAEVWNQDIFPD